MGQVGCILPLVIKFGFTIPSTHIIGFASFGSGLLIQHYLLRYGVVRLVLL